MRSRAAAWTAGVALVVAAAVPAVPAIAADPLPPCFPGPTGDPGRPVVPDPASGQLTLPAIPLLPGLPALPGIVYCDPALPLPDGSLPAIPLPPAIPDIPIVDDLLDDLGGLPEVSVPLPDPVPLPVADPVLDEQAPVFTQPSAQAGAESLEFSGIRSVAVVLVRTVDGQQIPAIRVMADSLAMNGFVLDVRPDADSPAAVNDSSRLELRGNVRVYLNSLTATGPGGAAISLLAPTPPPGDELPPTLLRATFGLVGATADSSDWLDTYLRIEE